MNDRQLADDWRKLGNYPLATVRFKLRSRLDLIGFYPNRSDFEEMNQEAVAFCWRYFREVRPKVKTAKHAVLIAARQAVRAVARGERFVPDCQGRRSVVAQSADDLDSIPCRSSAHDTSDYRRAERIISALPDRLRGIARQLAYGDNLEAIAHKHGRHPKTIERNVREMRRFVRLAYWHLCEALLSALRSSQ